MAASGGLTYRDRWSVELAARLMEKATREVSVEAILELASLGEMGPDDIKALIQRETISGAEWSTLTKLLAGMGMDPASRSKLSVPTNEKPVNRFATLAREVKTSSRPN